MKIELLFGLVLILLLSGCGIYRTTAILPEPRPLTEPYTTPIQPKSTLETESAKNAVREPEGRLTLPEAIVLALRRNPNLKAFSYAIREAEARALQAGLYPNPELDVQLENFGGNGQFGGLNQTETTVQLSQTILLAGKRGKAVRVAAFESDLAAWDYENMRLDVFTEVRRAFIEVLGAQRSVALNDELVQLSRRLVKTVSDRVKAGKMSPAEESRAKVFLSATQVDLERSQRQLESSRHRLAATWGSRSPQFVGVVGELDSLVTLPGKTKLETLLVQNPALARFDTALKQRKAAIALADARRIPNPTLSGGMRRLNESDDNAFVVGLSIPIPFTNRNQGTRRETRFALDRTLREKQAVEIRLIAGLSRAYKQLQSSSNEAAVIRDKILPEAQNAYDIIQSGYLMGRFNFLDVLDAQRTLFESRARYIRALVDAQIYTTEVERLIAQEIESIQ